MRIDLPSSDTWGVLSDQYRAALTEAGGTFEDRGLQVQIYMGYAHALWEVTTGLAQLFAHKKTIAIVEPFEPAFESVAAALSEEGYTIKSISAAELEQPQSWIDPIQTDLLFVLFSEDDPVTGSVSVLWNVHAALREKKIFRLSISHSLFKVAPITRPAPYEVRVLSLAPDRALLVAGERCRIQPPVVSRLPWKTQEVQALKREVEPWNLAELQRWERLILELESALPSGFLPYFKPGSSRLYDRAVFFHPEIDGSALIEQLCEEMHLPLPPPGANGLFDTTSPCRWENPRITDWLLRLGTTEEMVRGLVIVSAKALSKEFKHHLQTARDKVLLNQG